MKEKTIAKFKYENNTYKLLEITEDYSFEEDPKYSTYTITYLIIKNRKRLTWTKWKDVAKQKFTSLIAGELLQTKIQL